MLPLTDELVRMTARCTLLADNVSTIVTILILLFSGISWVMQQVAEKKKAQLPGQRGPAKALPARQAQELEEFLRRARQREGAAPQQGRRDDVEEVFEIVEERPAARPPQQQPPRKPNRQQPKPRKDAYQPAGQQKPAKQQARQPEAVSQVGQSQLSQMKEHLTGYMVEGRIDKQVSQNMPHLASAKSGNKPSFQWEEPPHAAASGTVKTQGQNAQIACNVIIDMFKTPQDIQRAIIVNEILQRPKCLTRKS